LIDGAPTWESSNLSIESDYVGRFAPSPTGPLHFGSVVAALASFLDARQRSGRWLLRIEDVDAPRTVPGAAEGILRTLRRLGLEWDGEVSWQSHRLPAYRATLDHLQRRGLAYGCCCSRREIADAALAPDGARVYPGTCRNGIPAGCKPRAWRLRVPAGVLSFDDAVQGRQSEDVAGAVGDFVLLRADGQFAYQLAVVVDDLDAGVTQVVRGADLLDSTARQIQLYRLLGQSEPAYAHVPVVVNAAGEKLSKQTLAAPVDAALPGAVLLAALDFLGQTPPLHLAGAPAAAVLDWSVAHWSLDRVPRRRTGGPPAGLKTTSD
jgi:glutamyl-Q tRNA(Asp) synthetase